MPLDYNKMSPAEQRAYNEARNARIVSFNVSDPEVKEKLKIVAQHDGRSINNWIKKYVMPTMLAELDRQHALVRKAKRG